MNNVAIVDEDLSLPAPGGHPQDRRLAPQALHLQHVMESHLHHAAEAGLRSIRRERLQGREQALETLRGPRFLQVQNRAKLHGSLARRFIPHAGGEHHHALARMRLPEQAQKLDAIHDRHFDIKHDDLHRLRLQLFQGLQMIGRRPERPMRLGALLRLRHSREKLWVIIDE